VNQTRVPFLSLALREDADAVRAAMARVARSGWFVLGPELEAFEHEFAAASGAACAVGVGNGTDALALILRALDIGPGDEVITTPLSAAYTALAIIMAGARPIFVDIDAERLTLNPDLIEQAITSRTRAIVPVHLYGQGADLAAIVQIAGPLGIPVVEDCCQAHLATIGGRPVGTFGVAGAFSFYPTKNLGALGDGGAVVTNDATLAARIRRLRNGGQITRYLHEEAGVNSRLDELQAAILRARLPFLSTWTSRRRTLAGCYRRQLRGSTVKVPPELDGGHVYHLFVVLADGEPRGRRRQALQRHLAQHGIETLVHYPVAIPNQRAIAAQRPAECPVAGAVCEHVLSLPLHPSLDESVISEIAACVCDFRYEEERRE
jgi:dTDP-4-amino-4,6-dideoxygalactose transaminase